MDTNKILYDYIVEKYGDVANFSRISGISLIDLNAILLKDNIPNEVRISLDLFNILKIDIDKIVFNNQIKIYETENPVKIKKKIKKPKKLKKLIIVDEKAVKSEIYNKCIRLSELEKKKVLEYIDDILNERKPEPEEIEE